MHAITKKELATRRPPGSQVIINVINLVLVLIFSNGVVMLVCLYSHVLIKCLVPLDCCHGINYVLLTNQLILTLAWYKRLKLSV